MNDANDRRAEQLISDLAERGIRLAAGAAPDEGTAYLAATMEGCGYDRGDRYWVNRQQGGVSWLAMVADGDESATEADGDAVVALLPELWPVVARQPPAAESRA